MPGSPDPARAWAGWGDPGRRHGLPDEVRSLVVEALGVDGPPRPPVSPDDVELADPALDEAAADALCAAVGPEHVHTDRRERLAHAGGQSYEDLMRRRLGDVAAPDAVVTPGAHAEVAAVLRACTEHRVAVVPYGGATSVVGGVEPARDGRQAVIALDLRRLDMLVDIDERSRTATLEAGLSAPAAETLLGERGWTIGHVPQSFEYATIGGFAATRSSGQASTGFGRFDDLVERLRMATPVGDLDAGRAPRSAAGPDLRQLLLGSEGAFGVITEVTVRVRPTPPVRRYEGWRLADFATGTDVLRALVQDRAAPDVARLSDETETALSVATGGQGEHPGGCLAIVGWEGPAERVEERSAQARRALEAAGGQPLGEEAGRAWLEGRFRGPYLRDELLDVGVLAETLETATSWSLLHRLHGAVGEAVRGALADHRPLVACHLSHLYAAGASLYFTVLAAQDPADPIGQWQRAKRAAGDAIAATGGTITHHHGVGLDHRRWMAAEVGELGLAALQAVKDRLDPAGIMNPGKLLPGA